MNYLAILLGLALSQLVASQGKNNKNENLISMTEF